MKRFQFSNYDNLNIRLRITHARTHPTPHNKSDEIDYLYLAKIHPMSVSMPCWNLQINNIRPITSSRNDNKFHFSFGFLP